VRRPLALGASLINLCASAAGSSEVFLMLGNADNRPVAFRVAGSIRPIRLVNYRLSPRSRARDHIAWIVLAAILYRALPVSTLRRALCRSTPWIGVLESADLVGDVRGGDSFSDVYGMRRFVEGFLAAWTVLLVKGTMVQFPQTYGPYKHPLARQLAGYLFKRSSVVMARDEKSRQAAQELLEKGRQVWLSPDVAFSLESIRPNLIELDPPIRGPVPCGVIGLNVNGLMANGGYTRKNMFGLKLDYPSFLPAIIKALLAEHRGELWLVPHTYAPPGDVESDPEACCKVRAALPEILQRRVRIVIGQYDQHEIKGVIGQIDFFIGSRMHACIAALSQGVPCVGIAYSDKFKGVFESVGMGDWVVDGRQSTSEQAIARLIELYHLRNSVRDVLAKNAAGAHANLKEIFKQLILHTGKRLPSIS
jgi:colanic acid/amylovoran biosynthesis protein